MNDATEASAGWYWQFNRKQGFKHDGTNRTPSTAWNATNDNLSATWEASKDPCTIELGAGWRLPTNTEWTNVDGSGGWTNWNGPFASGLKLHAAGLLLNADGSLIGRGSYVYYWSNTQGSASYSWCFSFGSTSSSVYTMDKAYGCLVRCLSEAGYTLLMPTVSTTTISGVNTTAAASGGNITADGGATVTARGVCWSTSPGPVATGSHTTDGSGTGTFTSSLTGLSPGTTYHVRAYATNSVGTAYGTELIFVTLSDFASVTTTVVTSIAQTTAVSGGNVTSDGGDPVVHRGVCWSTSGPPVLLSNNYTTDGTGTGIFTSNITGLTANTLYYVKAYATNNVGDSYGNTVTFTTLPTTPTVTTTAVTSITQTTATSGGNVTSDGGATVTSRGVCWSTTSGPVATGSHTTDGSGTGTFTSNITGLTKGTVYYLRAYATNSVGTSYGSEVSFTTLFCGDPLSISHQTSGGVAPVAKSVTYGTVTNIPGETAKCWITSNLGADHQATAVDDATEPSAGWYWQFNRKQGYKNTGGSSVSPSWTVNSISEAFDWTTATDPCAIELGTGWHVPTSTEWTNVDATAGGNWTTWSGPWSSGLKIHGAGYLNSGTGALNNRGADGHYWSNVRSSNTNGNYLYMTSSFSGMSTDVKALGFSVRCIRDN